MVNVLNPSPQEKAPPADPWAESNFDPDNIHRLSEAAFRRVTEHLEPGEPVPAIGIVAIDGNDPAAALGREAERVVFGEFFKNNLDRLRKEYEDYDKSSMFLVAIDGEKNQPAGVIRLIKNSENGLKSLNDIENPKYSWSVSRDKLEATMLEPKFDLDTTLDVATLAVLPEYRSGKDIDGLSVHLYYAMYQYSLRHDYNQWIGILDTEPLVKIQSLGNPLDFFEGVEARPYIDSPSSIPFYANLQRIDERLQPVGLDLFFVHGQGLDPSIGFDID
jgi:hypothetical protein